jgi:hypothetical protein
MVNRPRDFRHHDVVRAFRAAEAAGVKDAHVKIHLPSGTVLHVGSGGEVPKALPKRSAQKGATYAEGGSTQMLGKGDRTITAASDAAVTQQPGSTAHKTSARGGKLTMGGSRHGMFPRQAAEPAAAGQTGREKTLAGSKRASGGLDATGGVARPAKAGRTGC